MFGLKIKDVMLKLLLMNYIIVVGYVNVGLLFIAGGCLWFGMNL